MSRRRDELLTIAAELFAEHGFANVTVDDIGDAAGVSGPALYHHFAGKEALLGEMLVGISEYLLEGGREVVSAGGDDVVTRLIRFHAEFAVDDRALITVHFRDLVHLTDTDRTRVRHLQARYVGLWADALRSRDPGLDRRSAHAAVHAAFGLLNSTPFSTRLPRSPMLQLLTSMAGAALRAAANAGRDGTSDDLHTGDGSLDDVGIVGRIDPTVIGEAEPTDAGEILTLQRAAFLSDAQIYDDPFMPSLTQTVDEIGELIADPDVIVLTARVGTRLVGSVRADLRSGTPHVGRLMTAPDVAGRGIGSRLMDEIETRVGARDIVLETGAKSAANISFYERRGYREYERTTLAGGLEVVRMRLRR